LKTYLWDTTLDGYSKVIQKLNLGKGEMMEKVIVTVAITGNFHGKESNPNFPLGPKEMANAVYDCWNEGAQLFISMDGWTMDPLPMILRFLKAWIA